MEVLARGDAPNGLLEAEEVMAGDGEEGFQHDHVADGAEVQYMIGIRAQHIVAAQKSKHALLRGHIEGRH